MAAIYMPVKGRVYKINIYSERPSEEGLGAEDRARYPDHKPDGSPYGGRELKVVRHHYFRGEGRGYTFGCRQCSDVKTKGDLISN